MNEIFDIEIILQKQKYHPVYNIGLILIITLFMFLYVAFTYKYQTYYIANGTMTNGYIKLLVNIDDIKYITKNNQLTIDNNTYHYQTIKISDELYVDDSFNNYQNVYLNIENLNNIDNYVYEIKLKKEYKRIIDYLKDYL